MFWGMEINSLKSVICQAIGSGGRVALGALLIGIWFVGGRGGLVIQGDRLSVRVVGLSIVSIVPAPAVVGLPCNHLDGFVPKPLGHTLEDGQGKMDNEDDKLILGCQ